MFLRDRDKLPLQIILREIVLQNRLRVGYEAGIPEVDMEVIQETIKYAVLFVSLVPMLLMYPFIQRYFVKGVMIGSLKG
jgi:putative aldouronate transport system permease protein